MKKLILFLLYAQYTTCYIDVYLTSEWYTLLHRSVNIKTTMHHNARAGFFAEFGKVISNLIHYEQDGMRSFNVLWTHQFFPFKDDPLCNGWDLYFEPINTNYFVENSTDTPITVGNSQTHELHDQKCVAQWLRYDDYLPYRLFVHEKIKKYIKIKEPISQQVEEFYHKNLHNHVCIGIHVRYGKSHQKEAPGGHPTLQTYAHHINLLLQKHKNDSVKIYLASDSNVVIKYFKSLYKEKIVYLDTYRAQNNEDPGLMYDAAHYWLKHPEEFHRKKPGYRGGLGVLMDCLLLAKCDYFIHITSNVASYVCFFNPFIKSIFLPKNITFQHCRHKDDPKVRNPFLNPIE